MRLILSTILGYNVAEAFGLESIAGIKLGQADMVVGALGLQISASGQDAYGFAFVSRRRPH